MANGIFDMFGTDFDDPRTQGLLGLSLGLLEAGGYQDRPTTLGQALARGGQVGMKYRQAALEAQEQKKAREQQQAYRELQMQQLQQQMGQRRREEAQKVQARQAATSLATGGLPIVSMEAQTPEIQRRVALAQSLPTQFLQKKLEEQFARPKQPALPALGTTRQIPVEGGIQTQQFGPTPSGYGYTDIGPVVRTPVKEAIQPPRPITLKKIVGGVSGTQQFQDFPIRDDFGNVTGFDRRPIGDFIPDSTEDAAPKIVTLFDKDTGREYKAIHSPDDPQADQLGYVRVGGLKAPYEPPPSPDPVAAAVMNYAIKVLEGETKTVRSAQELVYQYDYIVNALEASDIETGPIQSALLPLKQTFLSLGLLSESEANEVITLETLKAKMAQIVPRMRDEGSGSTSNFEMGVYQTASPGISKTTQGNILLAASARQAARHKVNTQSEREKFVYENGRLPTNEELGAIVEEKYGSVFKSPFGREINSKNSGQVDEEFKRMFNEGIIGQGDVVYLGKHLKGDDGKVINGGFLYVNDDVLRRAGLIQ